MTDAKGQRTVTAYDVLGWVHTVAFIGADGVTEHTVRYERNEAGEKLTMTFTYDDRQCKLTGSVNYGDLDGDVAAWTLMTCDETFDPAVFMP